MKTCYAVLAFLAVLGPLTGAGVDTNKVGFVIKFKSFPDAGKNAVYVENSKTTHLAKIYDDTGMLLREIKTDIVEDVEYTLTVLEAGSPKPKKFRRVYTKASKVENGKTTMASYQGRTVLFQLKGDKYEVSVEGKPLADADLKKLTRQANQNIKDQDMVPKAEVKVGQTWKVDDKVIDRLVKELLKSNGNGEIDAARRSVQGKLLKTWKKNGKQWGSVEFDVKLPVKQMDILQFDPPIMFELKGTTDRAIDGSTVAQKGDVSIKLEGKAKFEQGGKKFTMEMKTETTGKEETK